MRGITINRAVSVLLAFLIALIQVQFPWQPYCSLGPGASAQAQTVSITNPHKGYIYNYRGNLHCHSSNSDGSDAPATVGQWYYNNGYDFYTITDHDYVTSDPGVAGILWVGSSEEDSADGSSGHMNLVNITTPINSGSDQERIDAALSQGGRAFLNHPVRAADGWSDVTVTALSGISGIEIFNGKGDLDSTSIWDSVLSSRTTVWGTAVDDSHNAGQRGDGYIVVNSASATPTKEEILSQIAAGNFYASRGFDLTVSVSVDTISVSTTSGSKIRWIKRFGRIIKTTNSSTDTYTAVGDEEYIRIEVLDATSEPRAWSQPLTVTSTSPSASRDEVGIYRASAGQWFMNTDFDSSTEIAFTWGNPGDTPLVGDFNGDGRDEVALHRASTGQWFTNTHLNASTTAAFNWGNPGDTPLVGDFNGDGRDDVAIYRPSISRWFINTDYDSSTEAAFTWGNPGDTPLVGDFNGDSFDDLAIFRAGAVPVWYVNINLNSAPLFDSVTEGQTRWGNSGDLSLLGDFNDDGRCDIGIFRSSRGEWFANLSMGGTPYFDSATEVTLKWADPGDTPLVGDFDGESGTDIGIRRSQTARWYFNYNDGGSSHFDQVSDAAFTWGDPRSSDVPLVVRKP